MPRISSQNKQYWCLVNPYLIHEVSLQELLGPRIYAETIHSVRYVRLILTELSTQLTEEDSTYMWFQQDSATANTVDDSLMAVCIWCQ
jgi:hypothetical protein